jgi:hypothetical protein
MAIDIARDDAFSAQESYFLADNLSLGDFEFESFHDCYLSW